MTKGKTPTKSQDKSTQAKIEMIKDSWRTRERISTLPRWGQVQTKIIQECLASLPEIDDETKKKITRNMLLTLRCHSCERARSDECNFSVCIRGLLSGQEVFL
jgi:ribosomal protein L44E